MRNIVGMPSYIDNLTAWESKIEWLRLPPLRVSPYIPYPLAIAAAATGIARKKPASAQR
jgi:hypothetical protein